MQLSPTAKPRDKNWTDPVHPHPKTMILVDGRKGGTGKTMVAMAVMEYLGKHGKGTVKAFDLDGVTGAMAQRYSDGCEPLLSRKPGDFEATFDALFIDGDSAVDIVVVDVGSPAGEQIDQFLIEHGPLDAVQEGRLKIVALWVVSSTPRSMLLLSDAQRLWDDAGLDIDLTIVANRGLATQFDFIDGSATGASIMRRGIETVYFPKLAEDIASESETICTPLGDYVETDSFGTEKLSPSRRLAMRKWLGYAFSAFDQIPGLVGLKKPQEPKVVVAEPIAIAASSPGADASADGDQPVRPRRTPAAPGEAVKGKRPPPPAASSDESRSAEAAD